MYTCCASTSRPDITLSHDSSMPRGAVTMTELDSGNGTAIFFIFQSVPKSPLQISLSFSATSADDACSSRNIRDSSRPRISLASALASAFASLAFDSAFSSSAFLSASLSAASFTARSAISFIEETSTDDDAPAGTDSDVRSVSGATPSSADARHGAINHASVAIARILRNFISCIVPKIAAHVNASRKIPRRGTQGQHGLR